MGRLLSRFGIGSARVDTILHSDTVQPGATVDAHVEVEGGSSSQTVDGIDLAIMTRYEVDSDEGSGYRTAVLGEQTLSEGFTVGVDEELTVDDVAIRVPRTAPPTLGQTTVWVYTGLDIDWSVDPKDKDTLTVEPGPYLASLLDAVEDLGFARYSVDNLAGVDPGPGDFVQVFVYRPQGGPFAGALDDVELLPVPQEEALDVVVEIDEHGSSLVGADVSRHRLTVDSTDVPRVREQVRSLIDAQL